MMTLDRSAEPVSLQSVASDLDRHEASRVFVEGYLIVEDLSARMRLDECHSIVIGDEGFVNELFAQVPPRVGSTLWWDGPARVVGVAEPQVEEDSFRITQISEIELVEPNVSCIVPIGGNALVFPESVSLNHLLAEKGTWAEAVHTVRCKLFASESRCVLLEELLDRRLTVDEVVVVELPGLYQWVDDYIPCVASQEEWSEYLLDVIITGRLAPVTTGKYPTRMHGVEELLVLFPKKVYRWRGCGDESMSG